jgi:hypothetical protein
MVSPSVKVHEALSKLSKDSQETQAKISRLERLQTQMVEAEQGYEVKC